MPIALFTSVLRRLMGVTAEGWSGVYLAFVGHDQSGIKWAQAFVRVGINLRDGGGCFREHLRAVL